MTKNILIATDFSLESLTVLKNILKERDEKTIYNFHFIIGYDRGDSIRELLFDTNTRILNKVKNQEFDEACHILKNKFANSIRDISFHVFSGYFQNSFNQFLDSKKIDKIFYSSSKIKHPNKNVYDLKKFIKKSKISNSEIVFENHTILHEKGRLAEFFT